MLCLQLAQPVMKQFREIESCLECSAKHLIHVVEVFYFALKAVIYPVAPLFDPRAENGQGALRPLCVRALKRVFLMNDLDKVRLLLFINEFDSKLSPHVAMLRNHYAPHCLP